MKLDWQTEYHRYHRFFANIGQFYQQKRVRVYTELVLSLFTVSFFLFFAIKPTAVTIGGLIKKIKDQTLVTEKLQNKINALSQARQEYLLIESELYLAKQALPQDAQISILVKELEALVRRSHIVVSSIQFSEVALKDKLTEISEKPKIIDFSLTVSGDYQNLKTFLQSLDSLRRIVTVKAFGFKISKTEGEGLTLNVKGSAFYLVDSVKKEG